ncbi:MAG: DUF488 domain-containing protein [Dehalococcoidia bacterium]
MIKTKSIYHDPIEPEDGYRLLVMRYWPRGVRKAQVHGWLKDLGPSSTLLREYRQGLVDWQTFVLRYRNEVMDAELGRALLAKVKQLERSHGTVTLLCQEDLSKLDNHCHREILKELLDTLAPSAPR